MRHKFKYNSSDFSHLSQAKEADLLVQNKSLYGDKEQLSQVGYVDCVKCHINLVVLRASLML